MPYELIWGPHGVLGRYAGHVSAAERLDSFNAICADPRFDDLRYTITDHLLASDHEVRLSDTEELAARHIAALHTNPRIVIAAVAVQPHIVAAIRDFIALGFTQQPYQVFSTLAEARAWVDQVSVQPRPRPRSLR